MRGFRVFLACLVLGVATTAAVGSLGEALKAGLARDARMILGGDVELVQFSRPLTHAVTDYLETNATALSHVVTMRSMAHLEDGSSRSLVELKAVDGAYPLVDRVRLEGGMALDDAVAGGGAVAEKGLLDRLGLGIGDRLRVGAAALTVRAVLAREPDRLAAGISLGPRLMMDHASLEAAGLMQPGALVRHRYRALIPDGTPVADWTSALEAAFPDGGWRLRDVRDSNPSLRRQLDRVGLFLTLAGLAALLVGGIGVASAVSSHLHGKLHTIAALKCVGATRATVQRAFLLQIGALGLAAIAAGLVIGAAAPPILAALPGRRLTGAVRGRNSRRAARPGRRLRCAHDACLLALALGPGCADPAWRAVSGCRRAGLGLAALGSDCRHGARGRSTRRHRGRHRAAPQYRLGVRPRRAGGACDLQGGGRPGGHPGPADSPAAAARAQAGPRQSGPARGTHGPGRDVARHRARGACGDRAGGGQSRRPDQRAA